MARLRAQDACPGALQVHAASDGGLVRIRLPGGVIAAEQLRALAHLAAASGSGTLSLTSRGSIQFRGITDISAVATGIAEIGLLPSATHDRVRNIASSPLSGRSGGFVDVRPWVAKLDNELLDREELAALPGRFWFSIDDGRGDVSGLRADIGVHAIDANSVALLLSGVDTGVRLADVDAATAMAEVALRFQRIRGTRWRIKELDAPTDLLSGLTTVSERQRFHAAGQPPVGQIVQGDGGVSLSAGVPLGVLPADAAFAVAAFDHPIVFTPWRTLLICDLTAESADRAMEALAPAGLVFDKRSPWLNVSACTGRPGCKHALSDIRGDLTAAILAGARPPRRQHWVGCPRACGSPPTGDVIVATGSGYQPLPRRS